MADHRSIKLSTHGILFMGTPHQGGNGVQLGRVLANVASLFVAANDRLLKHLERDSEWLQQQLGQYASISNDFVTKYAFEEYETPTVLGHKIMVGILVRPYREMALTSSRWFQRRRQSCQDTQTPSRSSSTQTIPPWSAIYRKRTLDTWRCRNTCKSWSWMPQTVCNSVGRGKQGRMMVGTPDHVCRHSELTLYPK